MERGAGKGVPNYGFIVGGDRAIGVYDRDQRVGIKGYKLQITILKINK
jgi:hypothetical protein